MRTIGYPAVLRSLLGRLARLTPDSPRRWGTLTPHEMLCHLGDANEMVLRTRPRRAPLPVRRRRLVKLCVLWAPLPWPRGRPTNPAHNPRIDGTRPTAFEEDRARVIRSLQALASSEGAGALEPAHGLFGNMSTHDWQRWAYRHTDHHLRQFGL